MGQERLTRWTPVLTFAIALTLAAVTRLPATAAMRQEAGATCSGAMLQPQASAVNVGRAVANANQGNMTVYDIKANLKCKGSTTASAEVQVDLRARYKFTYTDGSSEWLPSPKPDFFSKRTGTIGSTQVAVTGDGTYNFPNVQADLATLEAAAKKAAPNGAGGKDVKSIHPQLDQNGSYNIRFINAKCASSDLDVPADIVLTLKGGKGNTAPK
jgi:hypothetical protein